MLITEAINLLRSDILALGWVELYGGVSQRVRMMFGETYKSFPISCNASETDCVKNGRYKELTPDSSKKSILYWEVLEGMRDNGEAGQRGRRSMVGRARLVGWLNTMALGLNECNSAAKAIRSLYPLLYKEFSSAGSLFENSTVKFRFLGEAVKDASLFPYDYGEKIHGMLLNPYDYFALDVEVSVGLAKCSYTLSTAAPLKCIDNSAL